MLLLETLDMRKNLKFRVLRLSLILNAHKGNELWIEHILCYRLFDDVHMYVVPINHKVERYEMIIIYHNILIDLFPFLFIT